MKQQELLNLYQYLKQSGNQGADVNNIAGETGIGAAAIFKYCNTFPQLFVKVGSGASLCLNDMASNEGVTEQMVITAYEKRKASMAFSWLFVATLVCCVAYVVLV